MTLAKRLLLGSAAALVATTGAQAADLGLPVAPAVDYVQICSIGSFTGWILPGSDVCFDISGFARFQADFGVANPYGLAAGYDDVDFSSEYELNFDARTMTEWGLLRGFIRMGSSAETEDYGVNLVKAFVQIGGLTAGLTDSFFDPVYTDYAMAAIGAPDGGTDDLPLFGYSYAVGNGVTLMASIEDNDGNNRYGGIAVIDTANTLALGAGSIVGGSVGTPAAATLGTASVDFQDQDNGLAFVAAVRVDQAWGSAKLAGALTQVQTDATTLQAWTNGTAFGPLADDDELGWAVQASAEFNLPVGYDSEFGIFGIYTDGAISYMGGGLTSQGLDLGYDAVYDAATGSLQTTTAWALGAGLEFGLNAMTDLEFDGYYADVDHGNAIGVVGDYNVWAVRSSIAYRPVSGLELRAGVGYTDYDVNTALTTGFDSGFTGRFRITRSF
ncbi:MAG: porin [Hyphomicrobiales bacterium]